MRKIIIQQVLEFNGIDIDDEKDSITSDLLNKNTPYYIHDYFSLYSFSNCQLYFFAQEIVNKNKEDIHIKTMWEVK